MLQYQEKVEKIDEKGFLVFKHPLIIFKIKPAKNIFLASIFVKKALSFEEK